MTVTALASVSADRDERMRRWQDGLKAFFPGGPGGDDFVLLRLDPVGIEQMNFARGIHPDPYGLVPAVLERTPGGWRTATPDRNT